MRNRVLTLSLVAALCAGSAQASSIVGNVVGAVVVSAVGALMSQKAQAKVASCTLYDRDGNPVTVSCPADVAAASARTALTAAPPPQPVHSTPLPDLGGRVVSVIPELRGPEHCISCEVIPPPMVAHQPPPLPKHYARPPVQFAGGPPQGCNCDHEGYREEYRDTSVYRPRSVASFLSVEGGHTEVTYSRPRVVAVYDSYEHSSERVSGHYESGYVGGYGAAYGYAAGGVGSGPQFHPYGGVGYGAGGYAEPRGRPRVAGRDSEGFLTWPGKR